MLEDALQPPEDYAALKTWALEQAAVLAQTRRELAQAQTGLISASLMIEKLKIELARLRRESYGASSEKLARIEQLELQLGDLEETVAAATPSPAENTPRKPVRRPLPDHLPRQDLLHEPALGAGCSCPACGGRLSRLGEDATEELEYVPASFRVVRHLRPKYACRSCEAVHQAPMPSRPIERGRPGPGLLAQVLVAKYDDHLPLYRQSEIYAREGVELERSTLADWVGRSAALLKPLADAVGEHVMAASKLHADDTPVPVLEPGRGRAKTARLQAALADAGRTTFRYIYDFGDNWTHTLKLEKLVPGVDGAADLLLLEAVGRCPPEDCGGAPGYGQLLNTTANPNHEEHQATLRWCGGAFDPSRPDLVRLEGALDRLAKRWAPRRKTRPPN